MGKLRRNFRVERDVPHQSFSHGYSLVMAIECFTTLSLTVFTQRNIVADYIQAKCNFRRKTPVLRFEPHLVGGGAWGQRTMFIIGSLESAYTSY